MKFGDRPGRFVAVAALVLWLGYTARSVWLQEPWGQEPWGPSTHGLDTSVYYLGGQMWLDGESAYDRVAYKDYYTSLTGSAFGVERSVFVSPPTIAPIATLLALFDWPTAVRIVDLLQLAAWLTIVWLCISWSRGKGHPSNWSYSLMCMAAAGGLGAVSATMLFGQMGLYALAGSLGAIYALQRRRFALAVGMILLASIKAQLSLLLLIYALFIGPFTPFLVAGALTLVMFVCVEASPGLSGFAERFRSSMAAYAAHPFNAEMGNRISLGGLWSNTGFAGIAATLAAIAGVLVALGVGWRARRRRVSGVHTETQIAELESLDVLMLVMVAPLTLPMFTYDFLGAAVCLLLSALLPRVRERVVLFLLCAFTAKLHGLEERVIHESTPLIGWVDGHVYQVFTAVTALGAIWIAARRQLEVVQGSGQHPMACMPAEPARIAATRCDAEHEKRGAGLL